MEELRKSEFWRRKIYTLMKIRDTNRDGKISMADYKLVIQRYRDMGASEEHLEKMEKAYSEIFKSSGILDGTTALTYEQFAATAGEDLKDRDTDSLFVTQFEIVDSDGNGEISFKEWLQHYKAQGIDTVHAKPSFDAMDTNGDGIVSKEEYVTYAKEYFLSTEDKLNSSIMFGPLIDK